MCAVCRLSRRRVLLNTNKSNKLHSKTRRVFFMFSEKIAFERDCKKLFSDLKHERSLSHTIMPTVYVQIVYTALLECGMSFRYIIIYLFLMSKLMICFSARNQKMRKIEWKFFTTSAELSVRNWKKTSFSAYKMLWWKCSTKHVYIMYEYRSKTRRKKVGRRK